MSNLTGTPEECPVCMEELTSSSLAVLSCKHTFCLDCMFKLVIGTGKNSCPLCRTEFVDKTTIKDIKPVYESDSDIVEIDVALWTYRRRRYWLDEDANDVYDYETYEFVGKRQRPNVHQPWVLNTNV